MELEREEVEVTAQKRARREVRKRKVFIVRKFLRDLRVDMVLNEIGVVYGFDQIIDRWRGSFTPHFCE